MDGNIENDKMNTPKTNPTHVWFSRRAAESFGCAATRPMPYVIRPTAKRVPPIRYTDINRLWHAINETPAVKGRLVVQDADGQARFVYYGSGDFHELCKDNGWKCWAYIDSFLPYKY